jgi:ABC-type sugar transport system substrate-binding protein
MKRIAILVLILALAGVALVAATGCGGSDETTTTAASTATTSAPSTSDTGSATTAASTPDTTAAPQAKGTAAFVMLGLNNDFFVALKDAFEGGFQAAGWKTEVTSGEFNPQTQLTAVENYIAEKVDLLYIWEVAPGSLDAVAQQAMDAGIKVVAFVQPLANFDAAMMVDDAKVAMDELYEASLWTQTALKDLATINVAMITMDNTPVVKTQAQVMKDNLTKVIPTAKLVTSYDVTAESVEAGVTAAENIYTQHPEVNLILTVNASPALGANNYFTGVSSPVKDYTKLGIFTINGGSELFDPIAASATDKAPLRGTVVTSGIGATIAEMMDLASGLMSGQYKDKYTKYANMLFINATTLDEYKSTGTVTKITEEQFAK